MANKVASVLAFEKKLVPSDGMMYGTTWENKEQKTALKLVEKSVRGTIANRLKPTIKNDSAKLNAGVEKANLQTVDSCALEPEQDTLVLNFTLKVLGGIKEPSACNNAMFLKSYQEAVSGYVEKEAFKELTIYRKKDLSWAKNTTGDRFILWLNRWSNNYKSDFGNGIVFTAIVALIFLLLTFISTGEFWNRICFCCELNFVFLKYT